MSRQHQSITFVRHVWETLFSLHLAFALISMAFLTSDVFAGPCLRMEIRLNHLLGIRQTDFVRGYFALWIPSILLAILIWCLLRTFARSNLTREFLRSVAGIITVFMPLAFTVVYFKKMSWSLAWLDKVDWFEIPAALICVLLFLSGRWPLPALAGYLLLAMHFAYWYFVGQSGASSSFADYGGPYGDALGFCSALAWFQYAHRRKKPEN